MFTLTQMYTNMYMSKYMCVHKQMNLNTLTDTNTYMSEYLCIHTHTNEHKHITDTNINHTHMKDNKKETTWLR